jgi:hypothetical protein
VADEEELPEMVASVLRVVDMGCVRICSWSKAENSRGCWPKKLMLKSASDCSCLSLFFFSFFGFRIDQSQVVYNRPTLGVSTPLRSNRPIQVM